MIKIENLTKVFRTSEIETVALNNVNLNVESGEFVAVMGEQAIILLMGFIIQIHIHTRYGIPIAIKTPLKITKTSPTNRSPTIFWAVLRPLLKIRTIIQHNICCQHIAGFRIVFLIAFLRFFST